MYLEKEQLPYFNEWAECFCQYLPDFSIRVTSRAEGSHHKIKIRLHFKGQSHFFHVVQDLNQMVNEQRHKHKNKSAANSARVPANAVYIVKLSQIDQHWFLQPPRAKGLLFEQDDDLFWPLDPRVIKLKGRPRGATTKSVLRTPKRRRVIRKKVTDITEEEEVVEAPQSSGSLNAATMRLFQQVLHQEMTPMQAQVQALQDRIDSSVVNISDNKKKVEEEGLRSFDDEFFSPKHVQAVQLSYGTRSHTPAATQRRGQGRGCG
uniref:Zaragozic acid A biosynthesis cluster protein 8 n=1 Tax=Cochliobolus lunatus TaxID=5503 RepID=CLZ8_COCLU|nr:RecName: Full=Zaragozic acid A biosynthesis cluster protein 8; AltName: Full=Squalestatin S1 biosynthesis cluster protein clz8 [Curvularia lunata]AXF50650.1 Clz8 [Curvularia lunata]